MAGGGMSHPARAPRSGIDGQTNAAQGRYDELAFPATDNEAERMSHPARAPRSGIDGQMNAAQGRYGEPAFPATGNEAERMKALQVAGLDLELDLADATVHAVGVGSSVRPGRVRNRTKPELDEKIKKPADGVRKKSPPARKAPARGRYVDEYARPTF